MPPWWVCLPPVSTTVACRGHQHRIRWEAGVLVAQDHADPEAEGALHALGGRPPECLRLQSRWAAYSGDVALISLGRRPGEADLGLSPEAVAPVVAALEATASRPAAPPARHGASNPARLAADRRRADLLALLCLPVPFIDRLVLSAFARAATCWADDDFRSAHGLRLGAALTARSSPALHRLGQRLGHPVEVRCAPAAPTEPEAVRARHEGRSVVVTAHLSPWWLSTVWGAGISEVGGGFVLRVTGAHEAGLTVEAAEWEPAGPGSWVAAARPTLLVRDDQGLLRLRAGSGSGH